MEEASGITKGHVALNNDDNNFKFVYGLIFEGFAKANQSWPKLVERTKKNEQRYIRDERIRLSALTTRGRVVYYRS